MEYQINKNVHNTIFNFYTRVAKKYQYSYDYNDMVRNIQDTYMSIYKIENGLIRRIPTLSKWKEKGYHMANTKKWYFAYTVDGDVVKVVDARYAQGMHESVSGKHQLYLTESGFRSFVKDIVVEYLHGINEVEQFQTRKIPK